MRPNRKCRRKFIVLLKSSFHSNQYCLRLLTNTSLYVSNPILHHYLKIQTIPDFAIIQYNLIFIYKNLHSNTHNYINPLVSEHFFLLTNNVTLRENDSAT